MKVIEKLKDDKTFLIVSIIFVIVFVFGVLLLSQPKSNTKNNINIQYPEQTKSINVPNSQAQIQIPNDFINSAFSNKTTSGDIESQTIKSPDGLLTIIVTVISKTPPVLKSTGSSNYTQVESGFISNMRQFKTKSNQIIFRPDASIIYNKTHDGSEEGKNLLDYYGNIAIRYYYLKDGNYIFPINTPTNYSVSIIATLGLDLTKDQFDKEIGVLDNIVQNSQI